MAEETGPLSHEAVTAELNKSQTDPGHPQYNNSQKNPDAYGKWADGLYKRIAPSAEGGTPGQTTQRPLIRNEFDSAPSDEAIDKAFAESVVTAVRERGID